MCKHNRLMGLMVAALLLGGLTPIQAALLSVGSGSAAPGGRVSLPITYQGEAAVSVQFTVALALSRPEGAPPLQVNPVPTPGTTMLVDVDAGAGTTATGLAEGESGALKPGDLMSIEFIVPAKAPTGTVYSLSLSGVQVAGVQGESIQTKTAPGLLSVEGRLAAVAKLVELTVVPGKAQVNVGDSQEYLVTGLGSDKQPIEVGTVKWSVDPVGIATIDPDGTLVGVTPGTATVVAASAGVVGKATVAVTTPDGQGPKAAVTTGSASGAPSSRVDVPLSLEGAGLLAELSLVLNLADPGGPQLTLAGAKALDGLGFTTDTTEPGRVALTFVAGDAPMVPGPLATLSLDIPAGAAPSYDLSGQVLRASDTSGLEFVLPVQAGTLTVKTTTPPALGKGDANGDGKVNIQDVLIALRMAVGMVRPTPEQLAALDRAGDGKVDIGDVVAVLRMVIGLT
ncbi:MAG TPA: dockerin type I domain-containing protein [Armatimonadota bacterium]|jgi:hypothetical protein